MGGTAGPASEILTGNAGIRAPGIRTDSVSGAEAHGGDLSIKRRRPVGSGARVISELDEIFLFNTEMCLGIADQTVLDFS